MTGPGPAAVSAEEAAAILQSTGRAAESRLARFYAPGSAARSEIDRTRMPARPDQFSIVPEIRSRQDIATIERKFAMLDRAISEIFGAAFSDDPYSLASRLGIPRGEVSLIWSRSLRPGLYGILRPDLVVSERGFHVLELNAGSAVGRLAANEFSQRILRRSPGIGEALERIGAFAPHGIARIAQHLKACIRPDGAPFVAVTDWRSELSSPVAYEYAMMAEELRIHGFGSEVVATEDLVVRPDGVYHGTQICHALYRYFGIPTGDSARVTQLRELLAAHQQDDVYIFDDLRSQTMTPKSVLAVVSEHLESGLLTRAVSEELRDTVPSTRLLEERRCVWKGRTVDLPELARSSKDELLIKPAFGFAKRGLVVGREVTQESWADSLAEALSSAEPWLLQELVSGPDRDITVATEQGIYTFSAHADYGAYLLQGELIGLVRRNALEGDSARVIATGGFSPVLFV